MQPIYLRKIREDIKLKFEKERFYKKFGHLRVLGISDKTDSTNVIFFICLCDCGKIFHTKSSSVISGRTESCCMYVSVEEERERFHKKIETNENGCWIWKGSTYKRKNKKTSYGRFESKLFPKEYLSHRLSFLLFKGSIPENIYVCHICDVENCVNPDHLFLGDGTANQLDKVMKNRHAFGSRNGNSKYSEKIVYECRNMHENNHSVSQISIKMNIPESTVQKFIYRESWNHI